jgi:hypothetical protein
MSSMTPAAPLSLKGVLVVIYTLAPWSMSSFAIANPMPRLPPENYLLIN